MKPAEIGNRIATTDSGVQEILAAGDARIHCLVRFSSGYYWAQDENHRFTALGHADGTALEAEFAGYIGKASWEIGFTPAPGQGTWEQHKALRDERLAFRDFVVRHVDSRGKAHFWKVSGEPVFDEAGEYRGYRGIATEVTEQVRYQRLLELDLVIARILAESHQSTDALRAAIQAICESERWEAGQYWSVDQEDDVMRFQVGWHVEKDGVARVIECARDLVFDRGKGLVGAVWESGRPLWVPDVSSDARLLRKDMVAATGWRSALLVPVISHGELIGVLDFNAPFIPEPDEYVLHVIQTLAVQIGNFHQRAVAFERISESEARYSSTVELAAIGISHVGPDGRFLHVNRQLCDMLGYTKDELLARTVKDVSHPEDIDVTDEQARALRAGKLDSMKVEKRYLHKNGSTVWVRITIAEVRQKDGESLYDISIVEDISDRKLAEAKVEYFATHDEMTGLPNRTMFTQLLERAIDSSRRHDRHFGVLFINLDRFKIINDSLGHEAGDAVLKTLALRFKECVRSSDVVARLGGDEFVVLVDEINEREQAAVVARHIVSAALKPVSVKGRECRVTASVGVAMFPDDASDAESLMKNSDMAMYLAKDEGKNNFQIFSKAIRSMSIERMALETNLLNALERDEFRVQYQAKVSIGTGEIKGVEALLRWWNLELGPVSPAQFIPVAEETGWIVPIGKWVLRTACQQSVTWQKEGLAPVCMAVNISPRQFKDPGLLDDIAEVLESTGLDPRLLELEITESMVMHNVEQAVRKLNAIKDMGIRLAIDDFGTGYSSLAQLKQFPIDTLKVDRSFIRDIPGNPEDNAITEAIISMGRILGVTVVAEGVETAEQQSFLSSRSCDEMQGFFFSKPSHPNEFARLLRKHVAIPRV